MKQPSKPPKRTIAKPGLDPNPSEITLEVKDGLAQSLNLIGTCGERSEVVEGESGLVLKYQPSRDRAH